MSDINALAKRIHDISTEKGFTPPDLVNLPEKLMLSVSELAEALEEHRSDKPLVYFEWNGSVVPGIEVTSAGVEYQGRILSHEDLEKLGFSRKPEGILVEIADSIIRNLHMMHSLLENGRAEQADESAEEWTIEKILQLKVDYNSGRPSMHGRAY